MRGVCRGMGVLAAGGMLAIGGGGAAAQALDRSRLPPGAVVQPLEDPAMAEHRRALTTLGANPRSVSALIGAGRSAIAMGDGEAALSFFARADEIEPRNPRVKAGMASALVLLERGQAAMPLFAEALALGAPEVEIARDRGLAYDMAGDPRRAQQDYAMVLRRDDDPEVRRRLALSLAISGRREEALEAISAQLRRQDRAAWRTQAFVLALTGDTRGATETASRMMPGAGQSMGPFFARLASLSPAQKAMAVHFGHFPRDGRAAASPVTDTSADPGALALAQASVPQPVRPEARSHQTEPEPARAERRRPDTPTIWDVRGGEPGRRPARDPEIAAPVERRQPEPRRFEPEPAPVREPAPAPAQSAPVQIADAGTFTTIAPGFELNPGTPRPDEVEASPIAEAQPEPEPEPEPSPPAVQSVPQPAPIDLSDIAAVVANMPDPPRPAPAARPLARVAEARPTPARTTARRPAPPVHTARNWVQLATVPTPAGLAGEFSRLRGRAPEALRNRAAYRAPYGRSSHRLLVGPFETARAAQDFVNQLRRAEVDAFAWTSEAGQEIDRVQTSNASRSTRSQPQSARTPARPPARAPARGARGRTQPEPRPTARGRRTGG
jgi:SPOR domain